MAVSTVTAIFPPGGITFHDPGILRPELWVAWTGGTGPFDTQFQIDDDPAFGSPLIDITTIGVTSPHHVTATADLGLPGPWYWRGRVRDSSAVWSDWTASAQINYADPMDYERYLYLLAEAAVSFTPKDDPAGGWGPAPAAVGADGDNNDFARYLYLLAEAAVSFTPKDDPAGGWGPAPAAVGADGDNNDFARYQYLVAKVGVGFEPTDDPAGGWGPSPAPGAPGPDGHVRDFGRYLYHLANIDTTTPTPHVWYVFPSFGREGWEFRIIGYGFGDTQGTYSGSATLNGVALSVLTWELIAETSTDLTIDPIADIAEPVHQQIRTSVPVGGTSGLVIVCTDGP